MTPQSQPQKSMPMVAATGPMFTRDPMNFGIRRFAEMRCSEITVKKIIKKGLAV